MSYSSADKHIVITRYYNLEARKTNRTENLKLKKENQYSEIKVTTQFLHVHKTQMFICIFLFYKWPYSSSILTSTDWHSAVNNNKSGLTL